MSSRFERLEAHTVFEGRIVDILEGEFRHEDGETVTRQWVAHPGSVAVVAHDGDRVWLVRQPREATGDFDLLELPAGKLDEAGETVLECARRELAEEVGLAAGRWTELKRFYTSPGFADEQVTLYLATGLRWVEHRSEPEERIEVAPWPLDDLDGAIAECDDAKSLIGLLMLREMLR